MKKCTAVWLILLGIFVLTGCDNNSEDSENPCVDAVPYMEQAMETMCPSYEGCSYCEEIDYDLVEQQECTGQAREEAEMIMDDPEGMMASLEYTIKLMCEEEFAAQ